MILVDAHVHLYPDVPADNVFDAAYKNFSAAADKSQITFGVLMLADEDDTAVSGLSLFWQYEQLSEMKVFWRNETTDTYCG